MTTDKRDALVEAWLGIPAARRNSVCERIRYCGPGDCDFDLVADLLTALAAIEPSPEHNNEWFNRQFLDPEFRAAYEAELKADWIREERERWEIPLRQVARDAGMTRARDEIEALLAALSPTPGDSDA